LREYRNARETQDAGDADHKYWSSSLVNKKEKKNKGEWGGKQRSVKMGTRQTNLKESCSVYLRRKERHREKTRKKKQRGVIVGFSSN